MKAKGDGLSALGVDPLGVDRLDAWCRNVGDSWEIETDEHVFRGVLVGVDSRGRKEYVLCCVSCSRMLAWRSVGPKRYARMHLDGVEYTHVSEMP
jgi:hypothetical protein